MRRSSGGTRLTLMAVLLLPLISMLIVPLYDTSEPRYAEVARIMAQSEDWITPWFSAGVPFWGKPPLSFWAQALSMKAFGFTEFAARFPSWLCLLLSNGILVTGLRSLRGPRVALWTAIIYSTCVLVYISSGAVLTDPFLALGTTLSMVSFAMVAQGCNHTLADQAGNQHVKSDGRQKARCSLWWQYGFFLGLAIGLLAKGPLAAVLIFAPIAVWYAFNRKTADLAKSLPWGKGLALVAALSLPWYILAEIKTPGFLDYFIVGEHFRRFLDPGWSGDLYGTAHRQARGMIWVYWLQASFPWGVLMLAVIIGAFRSSRLRAAMKAIGGDSLCSYWLASALFTPLFFTFSANILWTYVLPSLAAFSIFSALVANQIYTQSASSGRSLLGVAGIVPAVATVFSAIVWINPDLRNTERGLVRYVMQRGEPTVPLLYLSKPPFSAQFYSAGQAREVKQEELSQAVQFSAPFYLAIPKGEQKVVAGILDISLEELYSNKRYMLVKVPKAPGVTGAQFAER